MKKKQGARDTTYFEPLVVVIMVSGGGKGDGMAAVLDENK